MFYACMRFAKVYPNASLIITGCISLCIALACNSFIAAFMGRKYIPGRDVLMLSVQEFFGSPVGNWLKEIPVWTIAGIGVSLICVALWRMGEPGRK